MKKFQQHLQVNRKESLPQTNECGFVYTSTNEYTHTFADNKASVMCNIPFALKRQWVRIARGK